MARTRKKTRRRNGKTSPLQFSEGEAVAAIALLRRLEGSGRLKRKLGRRLKGALDLAAGWRGGRLGLLIRMLSALAKLC